MARHLGERNPFGRFGVADDLTSVVVRDEAFWDDVEERDGDEK